MVKRFASIALDYWRNFKAVTKYQEHSKGCFKERSNGRK